MADGLCPVDIEDPPRRTSRASVFAFPNPATSTVTVRVVGDVPGSNVTVELYDMTGRRLARHFGTMGSVDVSLPFGVSSLPSGVYHAKVYTDSYRGIMAATTQIVIVH